MCGIIGYIGNNRASTILLKGLVNLEYRGYDSVGIAVLNSSGIEYRKGAGKINEVSNKLNFLGLDGRIGIAHNRWATHGKVTDNNAHPHFDCSKTIAIVHNGIIENYRELKEKLSGHKFSSETDSEVIAHLIEEAIGEGMSFEEFGNDVIVDHGSSDRMVELAGMLNVEVLKAKDKMNAVLLGFKKAREMKLRPVMVLKEDLENDEKILVESLGI